MMNLSYRIATRCIRPSPTLLQSTTLSQFFRLPLSSLRVVRPFSSTPLAKSTRVYVGSLSWNVDDAWLQEEFSSFGEILSTRVVVDRNTGNSKGFGFLEFKDVESANKAIQDMDGKEIDGRSIQVDRAQDKSPEKISTPSLTVFVGNLSFNTTQDELRGIFQEFGEITSVRVPIDRERGGGKGFGYVEFAEQEDATRALETMQHHQLEGRKLRLDYSQPRLDFAGGSMGGGRGRGGYENSRDNDRSDGRRDFNSSGSRNR